MWQELVKEYWHWSEVWAFLIPIGVWTLAGVHIPKTKPVVIYILVGFVLFFIADFS